MYSKKLLTLLLAATVAASVAISSDAATKLTRKNPTGTPIYMLIETQVQATTSQTQPEAFGAAQAAANAVNSAGGVKGHPIRLIDCDDHNTTAGVTDCAQEAVAKHVVAVQMTASLGAVAYPILTAAGIPAIGNNPFTITDLQNPDSFPLVPGSLIYHTAIPFLAKQAGIHSLSAVSFNIANAVQNAQYEQQYSPRAGIDYKGTVTFPATTTDFSAAVQQEKNLGAQAINFITAGQTIPPFLQTAKQFGLKAQWILNPTAASPATIQAANGLLEGALVVSPIPAPDSSKVLAQYRKELTLAVAHHVGFTNIHDSVSVIAWLAVHALATIGNTMTKPITGPNLIAAMNAQKKPLLVGNFVKWAPGVAGPSQFPRLNNAVVWPLKVKGGVLVPYGRPIDVFASTGMK